MERRDGTVEFVWLSVFRESAGGLLAEEDRRELELHLAEDPCGGTLLEGTGGFRSVEIPGRGIGEGGGARVVYFYVPHRERIYLVHAHGDGVRGSLTVAEREQLRRLAATIRRETR